MSFETSVFENGEWVTRTVGVNSILRQGGQQKTQAPKLAQKPLECGILTRTLVESPVVNFILAARLRSNRVNDVAFIGDHFVQICELRPHRDERDESLHEIIRKSDFGSRIRNAKVLGPISDIDIDQPMGGTHEAEIESTDTVCLPQMLVLALENGDVVFLYVERGEDGPPEFRWVREESRQRTVAGHPGFRMAIDPSFRHLALACPEGLLVVYELESMNKIREQYAQGRPLQPITKRYHKHLDVDIIQQMDFLYPQSNEPGHSILLLVIMQRNQAKIISYDWTLGDNIARVLEDSSARPHRLPVEHQTPILLIPITVKTSFLLISETGIATCKGILEGSPQFESFFNLTHADQTAMHHGIEAPLWAAWTRPYRRHAYNASNDSIYLGREDGVVLLLESDQYNVLNSSVNLGKLECNISSAFCGVPGRFEDLIIIGGESGPGALMAFPPRKEPRKLAKLQNWSPSVDLSIVRDRATSTSSDPSRVARSDRLFAATGRGENGAITEFRYGLRAIIGAEIEHDLSHSAWFFYLEDHEGTRVYHILVSVADRSDALVLDARWENVSSLGEDDCQYDLSAPTLDARQMAAGLIVQVTATTITLITPTQHARHPIAELSGSPACSVVAASISNEAAVLATHDGDKFQLHLVKFDELAIVIAKSVTIEASISAVTLDVINGARVILVATWHDNCPSLAIYQIPEGGATFPDAVHNISLANLSMEHEPTQRHVDPSSSQPSSPVEQITSVVVFLDNFGESAIVLGSRSGDVITVWPTNDGHTIVAEKFAAAASHVRRSGLPKSNQSVLVCADDRLYLLSKPNKRHRRFMERSQVFAIDISAQSTPTVPVTAVTAIEHSSDASDGSVELVMLGSMVAGSKILLTKLLPEPRALPRSIPVRGTATVLAYSRGLGCLVAAMERNSCTFLSFIDPETGNDLSMPYKAKDGPPDKNIKGLGKKDDKIYCIHEWLYENGGHKWRFFVVGTRAGHVIVVSTELVEQRLLETGSNGAGKCVKFWSGYKLKVDEPIFSVVASKEGVYFCGKENIHWQRLDVGQKKLVEVERYEIDSPAVALEVHGRSLFALSMRHSLEVIELNYDSEKEEGMMELLHCDPVTREAVHMLTLGDADTAEEKRELILLSDKHGGITGMTVPWGKLNAELHIVFDGELPSSIRKFRLGHFRPYWQRLDRRLQYGTLPSSPGGEDIIGLCIDGSLIHLTLLDLDTTHLLRLIQTLAEESDLICPFNQHENDDLQDEGPSEQTFRRHVNGDILKYCLDRRALEQLVASSQSLEMFQDFLSRVEGGIWTRGLQRDDELAWFQVAYDILEYFMAPVL